MSINFKKCNLTIIDETNVRDLLKIDLLVPTSTPANYYKLIEEKFVFGRYLYEKSTLRPIGYWICREEIANNRIICLNSILTEKSFYDIIIEFYRKRCIDDGNTLTIPVKEENIALCNYLKKYNPIVKYASPNIEFKFFSKNQEDFIEREILCQDSNHH